MLYDKLQKKDIRYLTDRLTNCYVAIKDKPEYDDTLVLFFNNITIEDYCILKDILKHCGFIYAQHMSKKAVFSLKFDRYYIEQYKLFTQGKYSKFDGYFKLLIIKFWNTNNDSMLYSILFKTDKVKNYWVSKGYFKIYSKWSNNVEYWDRPLLKKELLIIN